MLHKEVLESESDAWEGQHALVHLIQGSVAAQEQTAIAGQAEPLEGAAMPARRRPLVKVMLSEGFVIGAEAVQLLAHAFRQPTGKSQSVRLAEAGASRIRIDPAIRASSGLIRVSERGLSSVGLCLCPRPQPSACKP